MGDAGGVAARPVESRDKTGSDRVNAGHEDDRNGRGRCLGHQRGLGAVAGDNHGHPAADQIVRQFRQPIASAFRPTRLDRHVAAFGVTDLAQPLPEGREQRRIWLR
jgi:hypothetical protein